MRLLERAIRCVKTMGGRGNRVVCAMNVCSTCGSDWPSDSMAAIAVQLTGECLWCHFGPTRHGCGTTDELDAVRTEYRRRKAIVEYVSTAALR